MPARADQEVSAADDHAVALRTILRDDPLRWRVLGQVRSLRLPDCWIGAGFVRNAVWDHLHGRPPARPADDIDVVWFNQSQSEPESDRAFQAALLALDHSLDWSVKNQARMHTGNHDEPYDSTADAIRCWPETATAVAVRRTMDDHCEILAPHGLDDLFNLVLRPTARFMTGKQDIFRARIQGKQWLTSWPRLRMQASEPSNQPASVAGKQPLPEPANPLSIRIDM